MWLELGFSWDLEGFDSWLWDWGKGFAAWDAMGHLIRWSAVRFRRWEGQFRCMALPCAAFRMVLSVGGKVRDGRVGGVVARSVGFESVAWRGRGDGVDFCEIRSRGSQCRQVTTACRGFDGDGEGDEQVCEAGADYVVVNFYHFVDIEDAHLEVARHSAFVEGRDIRGRIYINHQGINAQFSGPREDAMAYANWVKEDARFSPTYIQVSPSPRGHAFPRLRLRYKPSLVQVCESGTLPLTDASARAVPLTPKQWREKLEKSGGDQTRCDAEDSDGLKNVKKVLLLDVRNRYEWDVGHFQGAQRPEVECFKSTEFGLSDDKEAGSDPLAGVDKENTDIMMYCTGGIRCDVYSTMLRKKGFKNLYSLRGGVAKYLKEEGASQWDGRLFVFDSRLAVPPAFYHGDSERTASSSSASSTAARCLTCGSAVEPVHRNCANLDCNSLYLSCAACVTQLRGCCCKQCMEAPKLRPVLKPDETYERWHHYRDPPPPPPRPPGWVSRRALKRRRRKERRKQGELLNSSALESVHSSAGSDSTQPDSFVHQL